MNLNEEEPRKVPKPVPFSQNTLLHPAVPEVSLILQDVIGSRSPTKNRSFSGTEFQTYNAWRWKYINETAKNNMSSIGRKHSNIQEPYEINDKFSGSEIEKRKNEILYGNADEPRRPLPPRPIPIIPHYPGASFSDHSVCNDCTSQMKLNENEVVKNFERVKNTSQHNESIKCSSLHNSEHEKKELRKIDGSNTSHSLNNIGDLYQIISEQNKQMILFQKQIEQLLKTQDTKEKQIEQLLKSQDTKESKIEQLLKMQDLKEKQIEQLLKAQEKNEKQIEQLIHSQELKEKQKSELEKQEKSNKEVVTVGLMTKPAAMEKSTNTSLLCHCSGVSRSENENTRNQSKFEDGKFVLKDKSFTLNSLDLPPVQEHVPTPQSSIHVDIPEYNGSSDEESNISLNGNKDDYIHYLRDAKPLGYTFYNDVLTQVNDIIHNHGNKENEEGIKSYEKYASELDRSYLRKYTCPREKNVQMLNHMSFPKNTVEKFWEIDFNEGESEFSQDGASSMNYTRNRKSKSKIRQISNDCHVTNETQSPTDISLKMNALALKYLKQEQISQYELHPQSQQNCRQADVTIYNVTNLSFGTMRYLERYQISSNEINNTNSNLTNSDIHSHQFLRQKPKRILRNGVTEQIGNARFK